MRLTEVLSVIKDDQEVILDFEDGNVIMQGTVCAVKEKIRDIEKFAVLSVEVDYNQIVIRTAELTDLELAIGITKKETDNGTNDNDIDK